MAARAPGRWLQARSCVGQIAVENLQKPARHRAEAGIGRIELKITPEQGPAPPRRDQPRRARRRQFGPAVRAEELLGKSIGMWIDRSLQLTGQLNDSHITALLELARKRQAEPIDLADDRKAEDEDD